MKASFRRIDYSLRPAKHAERRMLTDIFRRLRPFGPVEDYRYLGFGSLWFSDFTLFHRTLGIRDMQSVERSETAQPRFEANKPFSAITVHYDKSSKVLPFLDWSKRTFAWLDYDDSIDKSMLLDVQTIVSRAASGSVLAVSVQCREAPEVEIALNDISGPNAMTRFAGRLGTDEVPTDASEDDLLGWPFGKLSRRIFMNQIQASLATRNLGLEEQHAFQYTPICEIEYEDGVKMTTMVGVLTEVSDQPKLEDCAFGTLDFLPHPPEPIRIEIPVLTMREIRHIEKQLPTEGRLDYGQIPTSDADKFARFYRYLPNFAILEH